MFMRCRMTDFSGWPGTTSLAPVDLEVAMGGIDVDDAHVLEIDTCD